MLLSAWNTIVPLVTVTTTAMMMVILPESLGQGTYPRKIPLV